MFLNTRGVAYNRSRSEEECSRFQADITQGSLRALFYARKHEESLSTAVMGGFPDDGWSECDRVLCSNEQGQYDSTINTYF